ncbi:MAG: hypothetical protein H6718_34180 [Polyangiaceae bacterium]|nr:hypothetical protein [Myxococcales bacterium]MCB9590508.1 hypothetical protein [Polyangiaceae bacterium]
MKRALLLGLLFPLLACKLLKPSPEKVCAKAEKVGVKDTECVTKLTQLKTDNPTAFECSAKCVSSEKEKAALEACMTACAPGETETPSSEKAKSVLPSVWHDTNVDSLSSATLKSRLKAKYKKAKFSGETTNQAGWTISVLNKEGALVAIYKVVLADIKSPEDASRWLSVLRKENSNSLHEYRYGDSKLLYWGCSQIDKRKRTTPCNSAQTLVMQWALLP